MSSESDEPELSPAEHLAHIAQLLSETSDEPALLAAWSDAEDHVTHLYRAQSNAEGRRQMLGADYAASWSPILRGAVAAMSAAADSPLRIPAPAGASSRAMAVIRVLVIMRNLCTDPAFQRTLRNDAIGVLSGGSEALGQCTRLVSIVERSIAQESRAKEPRLMLKSLMQLVANMLTPAAATSSDAAGSAAPALSDAPWLWVHEVFYPAVLAPILRLHRNTPELASIATAIVHHALLCGDAQHSLEADVNSRTRACVPQMLAPAASAADSVDASTAAAVAASAAADALSSAAARSMLKLLLVAAVTSVESQLQAVFDAEPESAHKAPLSLWDWRPHVAEPCWIVSLVGLGLRSHGSLLRQCNAQCSAQEWAMLVRLVEVWTQGMHDEEDRTKELAKMQAKSASATAVSVSSAPEAAAPAADGGTNGEASRLKVTAENIAANAVFLLEWVQQREQVPLPPMPAPPADAAAPADSSSADDAGSAAASSSSASAPAAPSPAATSTIPVDHLSNSVLASLGSLLLFEGWSGSLVFHSLRAALSRSGVLSTLLSLLSAADRIDGGAMFSDLYRPVKAGHTRHTKESDDPEAYVNQFGAAAETGSAPVAAAASSSAAASAPRPTAAAAASPAPSSAPRVTPYLFKSNSLRLLSSLVWRHRGLQDEVGARGGIYALMNHSVLDDHNPLMREFSILGLRNALEDHEANQQIVSQLRVDAIANQDQLREMGVNTELDPRTGKIKIGQGDKNKSEQ